MMGKTKLNTEQPLKIEIMEAQHLKYGNWWNFFFVCLIILFRACLYVVPRKPCKSINNVILKIIEPQCFLK